MTYGTYNEVCTVGFQVKMENSLGERT